MDLSSPNPIFIRVNDMFVNLQMVRYAVIEEIPGEGHFLNLKLSSAGGDGKGIVTIGINSKNEAENIKKFFESMSIDFDQIKRGKIFT